MKRLLTFLVILALIAGCYTPREKSYNIQCAVSVLPLADIVKQVGGDLVEVEVLVGPGQSPATYSPSPQQLASLRSAQVLFRIGVPYEEHLIPRLKELYPKIQIVDLSEGIELLESVEHGHHGDPGHICGELDPHIWMDPILVQKMAMTIATHLKRIMPDKVGKIESNRRMFDSELARVDLLIEEELRGLKSRRFYVFHPAFGYFAQRYNLEQIPIESEGKEPSARQLAQLVEQARADSVRVVFVQPQFSDKSARAIADAIGGTVASIDPLAPDYFEMLTKISTALSEGMHQR